MSYFSEIWDNAKTAATEAVNNTLSSATEAANAKIDSLFTKAETATVATIQGPIVTPPVAAPAVVAQPAAPAPYPVWLWPVLAIAAFFGLIAALRK